MADSVTVTSHHSYGSRVGNSLKAILLGIILVWISIRLLAWNENNFVKQKAALKEWASLVNETTAEQINSELEWKEVHLYGETASIAEALQDSTFWVVTNDLKLKRTVEMYQWHEDSREECHDNYGWSEDCETTYTYDKKRSSEQIDSSNFHSSDGHGNPSNREFKSAQREKSPITLWAYTLTPVFINQLTNYQTINLNEQNIKIPENHQNNSDTITQEITTDNAIENNNDSYLYGDSENEEDINNEENNNEKNSINTTSTISNENFHIYDNYIYVWKNPNEPAIWDLKISFSSVKPWTISIVWKQVGNELTSYTVSNWRSISLLEQWNVTAEDMFLHAQQANKNMTRIFRLLWLFLMYCGFAAMLNFIETLAKVIPFLSKIIWVWTGIIALWLTIIVWFLTIWIAWLAVRPIIWICCIIVAACGVFLLKKSKKTDKETIVKQENIEEKPEPIEEPKE